MSAVHFEERRNGRIDVMLNVAAVGELIPIDHPHSLYRYAWHVDLPPNRTGLQPAESLDDAKAAAVSAVARWLKVANLQPRGRRQR